MLAEETILGYIEPGITVHGMDIGKWLTRQRKPEVWAALTDGQRERLEHVGVVPPAPALEAPVKPPATPVSAFQRGCGGPGAVQGPYGLCDGFQGPCGGVAERVGGEARGVPVQQQEPPSQTDRRQAHHGWPASGWNGRGRRALEEATV
ncbi:helicase associated domain-containing protein [Streptomyces sp. NPDC001834]|uniref:helicase associated domain-containing protein n=1 Tax=Streptomyces sp. NPDC001834 TaxID=3364616 RepID=UPI00368D45E1